MTTPTNTPPSQARVDKLGPGHTIVQYVTGADARVRPAGGSFLHKFGRQIQVMALIASPVKGSVSEPFAAPHGSSGLTSVHDILTLMPWRLPANSVSCTSRFSSGWSLVCILHPTQFDQRELERMSRWRGLPSMMDDTHNPN